MESNKRIRVAAGLIFHRGKLLIGQRRETDSMAGRWEFPGGKVRVGESDEAALIREIFEELHAHIQIEDKIREFSYEYPQWTVDIALFRCTLLGSAVLSMNAHQSLAWVTASELKNYNFLDADGGVIEELETGKLFFE